MSAGSFVNTVNPNSNNEGEVLLVEPTPGELAGVKIVTMEPVVSKGTPPSILFGPRGGEQRRKAITRSLQVPKKDKRFTLCSKCHKPGHLKPSCQNEARCSRCLCPHHERNDTPGSFGGCASCSAAAMENGTTNGDTTRCIPWCPICDHFGTRTSHRTSKNGCAECFRNNTGEACDAIYTAYHRSKEKPAQENEDRAAAITSSENPVDSVASHMEEALSAVVIDVDEALDDEEVELVEANTALLESIFETMELDDAAISEFAEIVELVDSSVDPISTAVTMLDDNDFQIAEESESGGTPFA